MRARGAGGEGRRTRGRGAAGAPVCDQDHPQPVLALLARRDDRRRRREEDLPCGAQLAREGGQRRCGYARRRRRVEVWLLQADDLRRPPCSASPLVASDKGGSEPCAVAVCPRIGSGEAFTCARPGPSRTPPRHAAGSLGLHLLPCQCDDVICVRLRGSGSHAQAAQRPPWHASPGGGCGAPLHENANGSNSAPRLPAAGKRRANRAAHARCLAAVPPAQAHLQAGAGAPHSALQADVMHLARRVSSPQLVRPRLRAARAAPPQQAAALCLSAMQRKYHGVHWSRTTQARSTT